MSSAMSHIQLIKKKIEDLKLVSKAIDVVQMLGESNDKKHGVNWKVEDGNFRIAYDDFGNNLSIYWNGKDVLSTELGIINRAVLQSDWIKKLDSLFEVAKMNKMHLEKAIEKAEEKFVDETKKVPVNKVIHKNSIFNVKKIEPIIVDVKDEKVRKKIEKFVKNAEWNKKVKVPTLKLLMGRTLAELRRQIQDNLSHDWVVLHSEMRTTNMSDDAYKTVGYNFAVMEK